MLSTRCSNYDSGKAWNWALTVEAKEPEEEAQKRKVTAVAWIRALTGWKREKRDGADQLLWLILHLNEQHSKRSFSRDSVRQHRGHIDEGAWLGVDLVLP
jgi:hypothetical protein